MAIVENPFIGDARNSFGNAVFYVRNGKRIMRSKPLDYKDPKTPDHLAGRSKFTIMVDLIKQVLPVINADYAGTLKPPSPFNKIRGLNAKIAFTGDPPVLDHTKVVLCEFEGSSVSNVVLTTKPKQIVHVEWNPNNKKSKELETRLKFIVINTTTNEVLFLDEIALRSAKSVDFTVPESWVGSMIALHIVTTDCSQLIEGRPKMIIKFKAGVDPASIIQ
jgi:hypothetical protein